VIVGEGVTVGVKLAIVKGLLVGIPIFSEVDIGMSIAADPFESMKLKYKSRLSISPMKVAMSFFIVKRFKAWLISLLERSSLSSTNNSVGNNYK
jgi:hypothetical protein